MFVNFINPRYPGEDTAAGTCHFRLLKNSPDVCQIRVDFVDTVIIIRSFNKYDIRMDFFIKFNWIYWLGFEEIW